MYSQQELSEDTCSEDMQILDASPSADNTSTIGGQSVSGKALSISAHG